MHLSLSTHRDMSQNRYISSHGCWLKQTIGPAPARLNVAAEMQSKFLLLAKYEQVTPSGNRWNHQISINSINGFPDETFRGLAPLMQTKGKIIALQ